MNKMLLVPFLSLLLTPPALAGGAQADRPDMSVPKPSSLELTTTVLDFPTGLRVLIQEDHAHPVVKTYMYVGHGFNDDPAGAEETAHFVEHIWFRSIHGDMPPIMSLIQDLGTSFNATTANDRTDYHTVANVNSLPILLRLESLRLTNFYRGVTEDQIDIEREVIRNEWRRRNEQNGAILLDYLNEVVYPSEHPYSRRSTHDTLNNITLDVMHDYVDEFYQPQNTTLAIVGDFNTPEVISTLLESFDLSLLHPNLTEEHLVYRPKPGVTQEDIEADPDNTLALSGSSVVIKLEVDGEVRATCLSFSGICSTDAARTSARPCPLPRLSLPDPGR